MWSGDHDKKLGGNGSHETTMSTHCRFVTHVRTPLLLHLTHERDNSSFQLFRPNVSKNFICWMHTDRHVSPIHIGCPRLLHGTIPTQIFFTDTWCVEDEKTNSWWGNSIVNGAYTTTLNLSPPKPEPSNHRQFSSLIVKIEFITVGLQTEGS
jgi:hypothetical protein